MDYSKQKSTKWGFTLSGAHLTFKMGCFGREANWMHSYGFNARPRKFLAQIISEFLITKKCMEYSTQKLAKIRGFPAQGHT